MKKQYIAIYLYGLLTAMAMIVVFHFYVVFYVQQGMYAGDELIIKRQM